jgi:hypothetical protein
MAKIPTLVKWIAFFGSVALIGVFFAMLGGIKEPENARATFYTLRAGIVFFSLIAWFASQSLISGRCVKNDFIGDRVHDLTASLHRYLTDRPRAANAILIISSAFIDILGVFLILASVFGPNMKPLAALIILFLMRQFCQGTCALPVPPGMIWRHPGFPSLLVTYEVGNDFFFSGHTAIAVLGAIEATMLASAGALAWPFAVAAVLIAFGEAFVVLLLRAHYTLDVITAIFAAFCAAGLANALGFL